MVHLVIAKHGRDWDYKQCMTSNMDTNRNSDRDYNVIKYLVKTINVGKDLVNMFDTLNRPEKRLSF